MSKERRTIDLLPPQYRYSEERFTSLGMTCGYCHGNRTFWQQDETTGEDIMRPCPMCEGKGKVDAEITIKWTPTSITLKDRKTWE